jgi:triacylglycerol lipase
MSGTLLTGAGGGAVSGATASTAIATSAATTTAGGAGGAGEPAKLGPPYPIVLAHGFFGFDDFAGAGFLTYFYGVREHLEAAGVEVYTPVVDPFNASEVRGAELTAQLEAIVAQTGRAKVNLVGHSQGGVDARVVAHDRPDLVASVITIATPHRGTKIADIALELVDDPNASAVIDALVNAIGAPLWEDLGDGSSVTTALAQLSTPGMAAFNAKYTDAPGVRYWSVAGQTALHLGGADCAPDEDVAFISAFDGEGDTVDPLFSLTQSVLAGSILDRIPNDGLVRARDARWGTFLGCLPADHTDEVGQIGGDSPGLGNEWEYLDFYDDLVAFLRERGL